MNRETSPRAELQELVTEARSGGRGGFDRLARRCRDRIRRWALSIVGDPDEAEDVAQAVLLRVHRYLDSYDGEGSFDTWLYRVTRNAALDRTIARSEEGDFPEAAAAEGRAGPVPRMYARELTALVDVFFRELPSRQRQIFDLADLQGYRPAEISEMLEMNPSTVRANLFKARKRIRSRILTDHPELEEGYAREM